MDVTLSRRQALLGQNKRRTVTFKIVTRRAVRPAAIRGGERIKEFSGSRSPYTFFTASHKDKPFFSPLSRYNGRRATSRNLLMLTFSSACVKSTSTWGEYSKIACAEKLEYSTYGGYTCYLRFI